MFQQLKRQLHTIRRRISPHGPVSESFRIALEGLRPGDIAIDCGANVGAYTVMLARTGADVHAFEPHPHAFGELSERVGRYANVHVYNKAVSSRNGKAQLFFHKEAHADPGYYSPSASLEDRKSNIDTSSYVTVDLVDFAEFVGQFQKIALLKMDIEGHEIEVLHHLLDRGMSDRIAAAFVELHDREHPALKSPTDDLRARIANTSSHFDLTWH